MSHRRGSRPSAREYQVALGDHEDYVPVEADGPLYDDAPADVPTWVQELPCALRATLVFLFFSTLRRGDSVGVVIRKAVLSTAFVFGIQRMISPLLLEAPDADSVGEWTHIVSTMLRGFCFIVGFFWLKFRPSKHGIILDVVLLITFVTLLGSVLTHVEHAGGAGTAMLQLLFAALALDNVFNKFILVATFAAAMLQYYNRASFTTCKIDGAPMDLLLPGAVTSRTFGQNLWEYAGCMLTWAGIIGIVALQLREAKRRNAAAQAAIALATNVAAAVGRYDTEGAAALIEQARVDDVAEPKLLDAFTQINANLERYRPHLPNWLVDAVETLDRNAEAPDTELDTASTRTDHTRSRNGSVHSNHSAQSIALPRRTADRSAKYRVGNNSGGQPHQHPVAALSDAVQSRVVFAELEFAVPDAVTVQRIMRERSDGPRILGGAAAREMMEETLHGFVDRTYAVAKQTGAAVHSFVGDSVRVTWNAASAVAQPEAKAARFLAGIRADCGNGELVRVHGAAAAGMARVQMAGRKATTALTMTLRDAPSWSAALSDAMRLARRFRALIVTGQIFEAAQYAVAFRGVGVAGLRHSEPTTHSVSRSRPTSASSGRAGWAPVSSTSLPTFSATSADAAEPPRAAATTVEMSPDAAELHGRLYEVLREILSTAEDAWIFSSGDDGGSRAQKYPDEAGAEALCRAVECASVGEVGAALSAAERAVREHAAVRGDAALLSPIVANFVRELQAPCLN